MPNSAISNTNWQTQKDAIADQPGDMSIQYIRSSTVACGLWNIQIIFEMIQLI